MIIMNIFSSSLAVIGSSIFLTGLTLWGELHPPIKDWLKNSFTHHWVGKSILTAVVFILIAGLSKRLSKSLAEQKAADYVMAATLSTLLCTVILTGFFTYEYFSG